MSLSWYNRQKSKKFCIVLEYKFDETGVYTVLGIFLEIEIRPLDNLEEYSQQHCRQHEDGKEYTKLSPCYFQAISD